MEYNNQLGFVFDAYLSPYHIEEIKNTSDAITKMDLGLPGYESYERIIKVNGIIIEVGIGMEWGKSVFYVPDFSMEEAIYFVKENHIDYKFGQRSWEMNLEGKSIKMKEHDDLYSIEIRIIKVEHLCVITIEDSM